MMFAILGLVLIGGLAMICFTKAFSIVFLGSPRHISLEEVHEEEKASITPLYPILFLILAIGLVPVLFLNVISLPISQYKGALPINAEIIIDYGKTLSLIGLYAAILIAFVVLVYLVRRYFNKNTIQSVNETWGCGYVGPTNKLQYTASSYIRTYRKLVQPIFKIRKFKVDAQGIFPNKVHHETHPYDKIEDWLIDKPLGLIRRFLSRFTFLQNGNVQAYILYGFIFITLIVLIPEIYEKILLLIKFLNQL